MKLFTAARTYLCAFSARGARLIAIGLIPIFFALGLIPIFFALGFVLYSHIAPESAYGAPWLSRSFAFWVDSIGMSILLLCGGAAVLDYAEKHDPPKA